MIKQSAIALCVGVITCAQAFAAREERTFEVWADIPTLGFYVLPAETNWIHLEQTLPWNINTSRLEGLRKNFDVKHDTSAIEARLDAAQIANARMNDMAGLWAHPQLKARERWRDVGSPAGAVPALLPPGIATPPLCCLPPTKRTRRRPLPC